MALTICGRPQTSETIDYAYTNTNWKDRLTEYNGQAITYDRIGNPLTYRDGMTMTWRRGRQLTTLQTAENSIQYKYDSDSIRTSKIVNGVVHTYEYLNGLLMHETRGEQAYDYYYDANGQLYAVSYKLSDTDTKKVYYFTHNWRGDIVGIYNGNGDLKATYEYDAWGNVTAIKDANGNAITSATHIANLNPFRYRGYYQDTETGLYYLMSRYYDPVTHRFLNADGYFKSGGSLLDSNMNAYCRNNPVNYFDPTGNACETHGRFYIPNCEYCTAVSNSMGPKSDVGSAQPYVNISGSTNKNSPNCYAYAIGSPTNEQPGATSGIYPTDWSNVYDVGKSVKADLEAKGKGVRVISGPNAKIYDYEFKIALRVGTKPYAYNTETGEWRYDYHFMRQTDTGQWAEKHGIGGDSYLWDKGMTPDNIPWTLLGVPYYDSDIIYYAVRNLR